MNIGVVGPGALGCLFASLIYQGTRNTDDIVFLIDYRSKRADAVHEKGVMYEKGGVVNTYTIETTADIEKIGQLDILLFCVKSYAVLSGLKWCRKLLQDGTLLVFLQNGITHLELTYEVGSAVPIYGVTTEGAYNLGPGHVMHAGSGITYFGSLQPLNRENEDRLRSFLAVLKRGGASVEYVSDILTKIWEKLLVNVGINGLTVLYDCPNGQLLAIPEARRSMKELTDEAAAVAAALDIPCGENAFVKACEVCEKTAMNISSMLQDIRNQRRTEIEAINGAVVKKGAEIGIPAPANAQLVEQIRLRAKQYMDSV